MKTASTALAAHLAGDVTTLCTIWKVTRVDGAVFGFTDHDQDLVIDAVTYAALTGYTRSAVAATSSLGVDNVELEGIIDSSDITADDIRAGVWDFAMVVLSLVNWADLTQGAVILKRGPLGEVSLKGSLYVAEHRGMTQFLTRELIRLYGPGCDADLGDARCKIDLSLFTYAGIVTAVASDRRQFTATIDTMGAGLFDNGVVTWTGGANADRLPSEVKTSTFAAGAETLTLFLPTSRPIEIGDAFTVSQGCDKTTGSGGCGGYSNVINFRGFPYIPGPDAAVQSPASLG